jgi:sulfite reductase (NADPH) flavoprotein alpha-component
MAAMAQLDCGQCGYLCQTYAEALADGRESSVSLCVPGAKPTSKMLKALLAEAPTPMAAPLVPIAEKPAGRPVRVLRSDRLTAAASGKDVRHVVIDLGISGLVYEPGDSIGLAAPNDPAVVQACLTALHATGDEPVSCALSARRSRRSSTSPGHSTAPPNCCPWLPPIPPMRRRCARSPTAMTMRRRKTRIFSI